MDLKIILGILEQGLRLWNSKEATKYQDKLIKLKGKYYDELKKPESSRSQLALDNIMLELTTIAEVFASLSSKGK